MYITWVFLERVNRTLKKVVLFFYSKDSYLPHLEGRYYRSVYGVQSTFWDPALQATSCQRPILNFLSLAWPVEFENVCNIWNGVCKSGNTRIILTEIYIFKIVSLWILLIDLNEDFK